MITARLAEDHGRTSGCTVGLRPDSRTTAGIKVGRNSRRLEDNFRQYRTSSLPAPERETPDWHRTIAHFRGGVRKLRDLFIGEAHALDHARVFNELFARHGSELAGGGAAHRETEILKLVANLGIAERLENLMVEPRDDVL